MTAKQTAGEGRPCQPTCSGCKRPASSFQFLHASCPWCWGLLCAMCSTDYKARASRYLKAFPAPETTQGQRWGTKGFHRHHTTSSSAISVAAPFKKMHTCWLMLLKQPSATAALERSRRGFRLENLGLGSGPNIYLEVF